MDGRRTESAAEIKDDSSAPVFGHVEGAGSDGGFRTGPFVRG